MLHFVKSCMKQNKSRKQTLESAQNELEIIFKVVPGFCIAHSYCARFLRHQCARIQNLHVRDFPQTKLVSEIKTSFSLKGAR